MMTTFLKELYSTGHKENSVTYALPHEGQKKPQKYTI